MATINPYSIVTEFEEAVAKYAGSPYAVAVESCTAAIFLSLMRRKEEHWRWNNNDGNKKKEFPCAVQIPSRTYPGVACSIIHAGAKIIFEDTPWAGIYELDPLKIYDSALRFKKNMYIKDSFYCLSFHIKKLLPIGRGGMILTDNFEAVKWLRKARFDGRNPMPLKDDNFDMIGWNMYMEPSAAARGIQLLQALGDKNLEDIDVKQQGYPDLSQFKIYTQ